MMCNVVHSDLRMFFLFNIGTIYCHLRRVISRIWRILRKSYSIRQISIFHRTDPRISPVGSIEKKTKKKKNMPSNCEGCSHPVASRPNLGTVTNRHVDSRPSFFSPMNFLNPELGTSDIFGKYLILDCKLHIWILGMGENMGWLLVREASWLNPRKIKQRFTAAMNGIGVGRSTSAFWHDHLIAISPFALLGPHSGEDRSCLGAQGVFLEYMSKHRLPLRKKLWLWPIMFLLIFLSAKCWNFGFIALCRAEPRIIKPSKDLTHPSFN